MSGMLPGVEAARRRRIHQSSNIGGLGLGLGLGGGGHGYTRRPTFCLYASGCEASLISSSSSTVSLHENASNWEHWRVLYEKEYLGWSDSLTVNPLLVLQKQRSAIDRSSQDEKLGQLAREAKERLDERLRAQWKPEIQWSNSDQTEERLRHVNGRTMMIRELQTEVYGSKKKKLVRWANKLVGWKASEQEECSICLDQFKVGDNLDNLPCAHRFHSKCLLPWLQTNAQCPCCRITIFYEEP